MVYLHVHFYFKTLLLINNKYYFVYYINNNKLLLMINLNLFIFNPEINYSIINRKYQTYLMYYSL